jgi:hypothetical protein
VVSAHLVSQAKVIAAMGRYGFSKSNHCLFGASVAPNESVRMRLALSAGEKCRWFAAGDDNAEDLDMDVGGEQRPRSRVSPRRETSPGENGRRGRRIVDQRGLISFRRIPPDWVASLMPPRRAHARKTGASFPCPLAFAALRRSKYEGSVNFLGGPWYLPADAVILNYYGATGLASSTWIHVPVGT